MPSKKPKNWVSLVPYGLNQQHPNAYRDMAEVAWENRDNLAYTWRILRTGVATGARPSAVSFAAVADGCDRNRLFILAIEEHPVVAATKAEAGERRLELAHVTRPACQVAANAMENLERRFPVMARRTERPSGAQTAVSRTASSVTS